MLENQGQQRQAPDQRIMDGALVYDVNGVKVGSVGDRGLQRNALIVHKGIFFPKELYIPLSAVSGHDANGVYLNLPKDEINSHNWDTPPTESGVIDASPGTTPGMGRADSVDTAMRDTPGGYERADQYDTRDRPAPPIDTPSADTPNMRP